MRMNNLSAEIGYQSLIHHGEQLCGDHVDVVESDNSTVIVLADGLGSGVKASILSTLTSKIISTMLAAELSLVNAVETIAATLPICSERNEAFSTFTIIRLENGNHADIIQYENPNVIMIRDGESVDYPLNPALIGGKTVYRSSIEVQDGDIFIAMSDGVLYASPDGVYNEKWNLEGVADYIAPLLVTGFSAKTIASIILDETNRLYGGKPFDDATVCAVKIRQREPVNIAIGPPRRRDDNQRMMSLFFGKEGRHIVSGGTTASIAAEYLHEPVHLSYTSPDPDIPPISEINGVSLVTEGIITMDRVLAYAKDYLEDNSTFEQWGYKKDGASQIARMLFEEATDINMFIGHAENPAHSDLPINFNVKMSILTQLADCLRKMGKRVKVLDF